MFGIGRRQKEENLRAAVIGAGYLGKFHAQKYEKLPGVTLAAVVDVLDERARAIASGSSAAALTDYRKLPELGIDCASVVSDTSSHFEVASWLLSNGIDVLVEKPMTRTVAEGQELIRIAEANKRILQVGHLERFNPAFTAVKEVLTAPVFIEARRIAPFTGRGADVDVVRDLMIHDIDIIAHIVGRQLVRVEALGVPVITSSIDIANARLVFDGGAVANVTASRAAYKSERSIRVFQPDVYVSIDFGNKKIKIATRSGKPKLGFLPAVDLKEIAVEDRDALNDEIQAFLSSVSSRATPTVTGADGLRAVELADTIYSALQQNTQENYGALLAASS